MAKRYTPEQRKPRLKGALLYLLPLPLLLDAVLELFAGDVRAVLGSGVGFVLAMLGAVLMRRGIVIEAKSTQRKLMRRSSSVPYKMVGAVVVGAAMGVLAWIGLEKTLLQSALYAGFAFTGCWLYYGRDPSRSHPEIAAIGITAEEVIELLEEAEGRIANIEKARRQIANPELNDRLRSIVKGARRILEIIEDDPRDARRARKFLRVYLDGAMQVTQGYAKTHALGESAELEANFRRVLGTIETVISEQQQKLLENNLSELDVTIEVLQMQLEKEGVT